MLPAEPCRSSGDARIAAGDFDPYIRQWARAAKALGGPLVVRLAHEMEGGWFPWGVGRGGNTAANFVAAWRHVWNIFRGPTGEGATNVRFLWSPYTPTASVYPGPQFVDYVGFTAFNWASGHTARWRSMKDVLAGHVRAARQFRKPIIVAELGTPPDEQGSTKAWWIRSGYAAAYREYPEIVGIVYFNVDTSPGQPNWKLGSPSDSLTAYREVLDKPEFQGSLLPPDATGDTSPPTIQLPRAALVSPQFLGANASAHVTWPAATDPSGINHYELQMKKGHGAWVDVTLASPTATTAQVQIVPKKPYSFRLRATDGASNTSRWAIVEKARLKLVQETPSGKLRYVGAFTSDALVGAVGGRVMHSAIRGRVTRLSFTGSSVAFVTTLGQSRGMAEVWLDGSRLATLDLYSAVTRTKPVAWAASVTPGRHILEVRVAGTHNHSATGARVDVDAFLVWR